MKTIYVAHRLFALHDRMLAAEIANRIQKKTDFPIFLPYCDTNEDTIEVPKKGFYLFTEDVKRLNELSAIVAILHGPSYDDGVCFEIGYAYRRQVPLFILTTDFLTYSYSEGLKQYSLVDPLLLSLNPKLVRISDPVSSFDKKTSNSSRYRDFYRRNRVSLNSAIETISDTVVENLKNHNELTVQTINNKKRLFFEKSPFFQSSDLERIKTIVENKGWEFYSSQRFNKSQKDIKAAADKDLKMALESSVIIIDGNGPEVSVGASIFAGIALADNKTSILYYSGSQVTHAHGREENMRNLMLLYGCSMVATSFQDVKKILLTILDNDIK